MSIASELSRILAAKAALKEAINNKGQNITTETIDAYPNFVANITTGGGEPPFNIYDYEPADRYGLGYREVRFFDYDATLLKSEWVKLGESATPPTLPASVFPRPDFTFDYWLNLDDSINVTRDADVAAVGYPSDEKNYLIFFVSPNDTVSFNLSKIGDGTVSWDWGDGSAVETNSGAIAGDKKFSLSHTYTNGGYFQFKIWVSEDTNENTLIFFGLFETEGETSYLRRFGMCFPTSCNDMLHEIYFGSKSVFDGISVDNDITICKITMPNNMATRYGDTWKNGATSTGNSTHYSPKDIPSLGVYTQKTFNGVVIPINSPVLNSPTIYQTNAPIFFIAPSNLAFSPNVSWSNSGVISKIFSGDKWLGYPVDVAVGRSYFRGCIYTKVIDAVPNVALNDDYSFMGDDVFNQCTNLIFGNPNFLGKGVNIFGTSSFNDTKVSFIDLSYFNKVTFINIFNGTSFVQKNIKTIVFPNTVTRVDFSSMFGGNISNAPANPINMLGINHQACLDNASFYRWANLQNDNIVINDVHDGLLINNSFSNSHINSVHITFSTKRSLSNFVFTNSFINHVLLDKVEIGNRAFDSSVINHFIFGNGCGLAQISNMTITNHLNIHNGVDDNMTTNCYRNLSCPSVFTEIPALWGSPALYNTHLGLNCPNFYVNLGNNVNIMGSRNSLFERMDRNTKIHFSSKVTIGSLGTCGNIFCNIIFPDQLQNLDVSNLTVNITTYMFREAIINCRLNFVFTNINNADFSGTVLYRAFFTKMANTLDFSESIKSIGANTFNMAHANVIANNRLNLTTLIFRNTTPPTLHATGFGNEALMNTYNISVYVPDASVNAYKEATNWVAIANRILPISDIEP